MIFERFKLRGKLRFRSLALLNVRVIQWRKQVRWLRLSVTKQIIGFRKKVRYLHL